jgi:acyl carrier protein
MTAEETRQAIKDFLVESFLFDETFTLGDNDSLQDGGVMDSAGVLTLISFLEERFEISVGEDDVRPQNLDTLANLTAFVLRKCAGS